ncbi:hypothetical protein Dsin_010419 [Dipteronia sinensis]|uniref:F-box domain-containing protein n=1 Tax=Dipteronia sinensis TaxID=43782 RepID=A0AAE0ATT6_9ROSI|nr:hypothetical protein Dsin_010419 [Dipteronia sinensis]
MAKETKKTEKQQEDTNEIYGDMLEAIFSHVPLIDLVPASHVSKAWNRAVFSSLCHLNKVKPWLMVHAQKKRPPHVKSTLAYDPRSRVWIEIKQPPVSHVSVLRSSNSTLLYMLSPTRLSFSSDPLHLTWHHVDVPLSWRTDPIVAAAGDLIVLAGGACEFEDDPLAVEIYNVRNRTWKRCENMPAILKDSAAATWLSVAANCGKIYVSEKYSGVTYSFDPETKTWRGPYDLRPDQNMFFSTIAFSDDNRLILIGLTGMPESVRSVKVWEVKGESMEELREIGEMPEEVLEKLKGIRSCEVSSVTVTSAGDTLYIHNNSNPEEIAVCEIVEGEVCEWSSLKNVLVNDETEVMDRLVFTSSRVSMADLQRALSRENATFAVKQI